WGFASSQYITERDVIIFEQRGNRYAQPALMCDYEDIANFDQESTPCLDQILAQGVDISQYITAVIAEDIEALRLALDIDQWNLYGTSYSTRLMQDLMANHPDGIRSAILQSVSPLHDTRYEHDPEHSARALAVMFSDCAADLACAAEYPDLEEKFAEAVAVLNDDPVELEFANPDTGEKFPYTVDGNTFISWMVGDSFYGPAYPRYTTAYLPLLIQAASQRNITILRKWAAWNLEKDVFLSPDFSYGVYFGVNCQDDIRQMTEAQYQAQTAAYPELDGYLRHWEEFQACALWGLPQAPLLADVPVKSEIPTLILAGRYDPITPPEWAQQVAASLVNAFYVEFPSEGHSLDAISSCPEFQTLPGA
ncbi:MAG: alpha/beta fold hydrolase, partial [Anaerolineales bacterium]